MVASLSSSSPCVAVFENEMICVAHAHTLQVFKY